MATAYQVAKSGQVVYVRPIGLASMKNASVLDAFFQAEIVDPVHTTCVDLSACLGMDSTFMGMLVGTAGMMSATGGKVVLVNPSEANLRLLTMLGITEVLPVLQGCELPDLTFVDLGAEANAPMRERMELIRRAHASLIELNDANKAKFSTFLASLESDLLKHSTK